MIYVTHDQVEAMTLADKIVVLNGGVIEQVGSPLELYRNPKNKFVAGFIGSPKMNLLSGPEAASRHAHTIGARPEHISISTQTGDWQGKIGVSEHLGSDTFFRVHCDLFEDPIMIRAHGDLELKPGENVFLSIDPMYMHRFDEAGDRIA